jgi:hypothetical protein
MVEQRFEPRKGLMKISKGWYINVYVPWEGLYEVGKWQVGGGQENKGEEGQDESYY